MAVVVLPYLYPAYTRRMNSPSNNVQYALFAVLILCLIGTGVTVLSMNRATTVAVETPADTGGAGALDKKLLNESARQKAEKIDTLPAWMVLLIGFFVMAQVVPLILAYNRSRRSPDRQQLRVISFLCEIPMYLGLLGSLVGVCVTQVVTGSLAAPLAYLTTISGILLYLFGRYTIVLSLPDPESTNFLHE